MTFIIRLLVDQVVQTKVVQSWVDLAFAHLHPPGAEKNPRIWVDHAMLHCFVEFYYNLAYNDSRGFNFINQARRQRGLDDLRWPHEYMVMPTPTTRQTTRLAPLHIEPPHSVPTLNEARIETRTARANGILDQGISCSPPRPRSFMLIRNACDIRRNYLDVQCGGEIDQ